MQKDTKMAPIQFEVTGFACSIEMEGQTLKVQARELKTDKASETMINNSEFPPHLKRYFKDISQIYSYFLVLTKNASLLQRNCSMQDGILSLRIRPRDSIQSTSGSITHIQLHPKVSEVSLYEKLKKGLICEQLNHYRNSRLFKNNIEIIEFKHRQSEQEAMRKSIDANAEIKIKNDESVDWRKETDQLNVKVQQMSRILSNMNTDVSGLKQFIDVKSLESLFVSYEKRQEVMLQKMSKIGQEVVRFRLDKKEMGRRFQEQVQEIWSQIGRLREGIKNPTNYFLPDFSVSSVNTTLLGDLSREHQNSTKTNVSKPFSSFHKQNQSIDKPIDFVRKQQSHDATVFLPNTSFALNQEELEKFKMGLEDMSICRKKIRQLEKRIQSSLPPTQIWPKFAKCKFASEFDFREQNGETDIAKKAVDKKCQLVGQAFPNRGRIYFKIQLVSVPHGYIHVGIVSGQEAVGMSSHATTNSINYFGGNGSINDKGVGMFVGKQLQNLDTISVLVDMDAGKVMFIIRRHVLGEASLRGFDLTKGLFPYVQLFYGGSKVKLVTY